MTLVRASAARFGLSALLLAACAAAPLRAQRAPSQASRVTVAFEDASIPDVLTFFSRYSGRSIVADTGVAGTVTARIESQPWDEALDALLAANGFYARELPTGIIVVESPKAPTAGGTVPLATRVFRLNYSVAAELEPAVKSMLTPRGTVSSVPSLNALVVTDEPRVLERVGELLGGD